MNDFVESLSAVHLPCELAAVTVHQVKLIHISGNATFNELRIRLLVSGLLQEWMVGAIVSVECLGSQLPILPAKSYLPRTVGAGVRRFVRGNFPQHPSPCHDLEYRTHLRVLMSVFPSDTCVIPDLCDKCWQTRLPEKWI